MSKTYKLTKGNKNLFEYLVNFHGELAVNKMVIIPDNVTIIVPHCCGMDAMASQYNFFNYAFDNNFKKNQHIIKDNENNIYIKFFPKMEMCDIKLSMNPDKNPNFDIYDTLYDKSNLRNRLVYGNILKLMTENIYYNVYRMSQIPLDKIFKILEFFYQDDIRVYQYNATTKIDVAPLVFIHLYYLNNDKFELIDPLTYAKQNLNKLKMEKNNYSNIIAFHNIILEQILNKSYSIDIIEKLVNYYSDKTYNDKFDTDDTEILNQIRFLNHIIGDNVISNLSLFDFIDYMVSKNKTYDDIYLSDVLDYLSIILHPNGHVQAIVQSCQGTRDINKGDVCLGVKCINTFIKNQIKQVQTNTKSFNISDINTLNAVCVIIDKTLNIIIKLEPIDVDIKNHILQVIPKFNELTINYFIYHVKSLGNYYDYIKRSYNTLIDNQSDQRQYIIIILNDFITKQFLQSQNETFKQAISSEMGTMVQMN